MTIGETTYTLYTCFVDQTNLGSYNNIEFKRYGSDQTTDKNWTIWGGYVSSVSGSWKNTFEITTAETASINEWGDKWWKVTTHTGRTDNYSSEEGTVSGHFIVNNTSSIDHPGDVPDGYSFAGWYTDAALSSPWNETVTGDLTLYAKYASTVYTITKQIYYDGVYQSQTTVNVEEGADHVLSAPDAVEGYHFDGWYSDNTFTSAVTTLENVSANMTVCANLKSRSSYEADSYFYYIENVAEGYESENYVYTYGGNSEFGAWHGGLISSVGTDVHGSLGFRGWADSGYIRKIYKIPFNSVFADTTLIINSSGEQAADAVLTSGAAYTWDGGKDADAGAAIDFLISAEAKRNAVTESSRILNYSICGISKSDAATLYSAYSGLSKTAKGYVDASYTYTYLGAYDGKNVPSQGGVLYSVIMAKLYEIANAEEGAKLTVATYFNSTSAALIAFIAGAVMVTSVGAFFLLRRKKEDR
ncbi:MAG: InlB B-repeat-containing protein [Bacilli bacterium]|nr:InlB B-repeat-containing protein [Bacilli bacterium]